tara:strand:+ start:765 stop:1415 length:651 start_codon:yes stop_codon:yes gene_type:complete
MAAAPSNNNVSMASQASLAPQQEVSLAQSPQIAQQAAAPAVLPSPLAAPPAQPIAADGSVIFSEYQAQVFNRVEALYKTQGFLSQPLFEDSYLLSKATATYVIGNVEVAGSQEDVTITALSVYRGVLGISAPTIAPPPPTATGQVAVTPTKFTPPANTQVSVTSVPTSTTVAQTNSTPYQFNYQGLSNMGMGGFSGINLSNLGSYFSGGMYGNTTS